jgi:hypothetical protein
MPKVDYGVIEERSFEPVPEGIYEATLTDWELKQGGKGPYYNFEFTALDPELKNRKFWLMSSISDGALWKFKQHMLAMGADPELMAPGSEVDTDDIVRECVGAEVRLVIKTEQYTAKDGRFSPHFPSN